MRLGGEPVGRWGAAVLLAAAVTGGLLAWHGWNGGRAGAVPALAGSPGRSGRSAAGTPGAPSRAGRSPGAAAPSPAATASPAASTGPLLSSEPFASVAFQVWPGTPSPVARQALTGLRVSVHRTASGISVTAGVAGQSPGKPRLYVGGVKVYVVEAAMGDDSGNSDYNLGDDGLVVTDARGRIIQ